MENFLTESRAGAGQPRHTLHSARRLHKLQHLPDEVEEECLWLCRGRRA